jgi:hypothetical protein
MKLSKQAMRGLIREELNRFKRSKRINEMNQVDSGFLQPVSFNHAYDGSGLHDFQLNLDHGSQYSDPRIYADRIRKMAIKPHSIDTDGDSILLMNPTPGDLALTISVLSGKA